MKKRDDLIQAIIELRETEALSIVKMRLDTGDDPLSILDDTREALRFVGDRFDTGDYFIPGLIFSGEITKEISTLIKPHVTGEIKREHLGTVVLGTVKGDIHDIGKDMVSFMLEINGFEVHDLGLDVSVDRFVSCVKETGAQVMGLSAFLTGCIQSMKATVMAIKEAGLRDKVKIMIGGNFISDLVCHEVGADNWGRDAGAAVRLARMWTGHEG